MEDKNILYVVVLALVAIVAMVALSSQGGYTMQYEAVPADENTVGHAMRGYTHGAIYSGQRESAAATLPNRNLDSGIEVVPAAPVIPEFPTMQYRAKKDTGSPPPPPPPPPKDDE